MPSLVSLLDQLYESHTGVASSIQVGPPNTGGEDTTRFTLTSEAGLNDGLAFPFVYLAIKIAEAYSGGQRFTGEMLWSWFTHDVLWKIGAGLVVGVIVGKVMAKLVFQNTAVRRLFLKAMSLLPLPCWHMDWQNMCIATALLRYSSPHLHFGAQSVSTPIMRSYMTSLNSQKGLLMSLVLVIFGMFLGQGLQAGVELTWRVYIVSFTFLLLIRPLGAMVALSGLKMHHTEKYAISALGIRGIGTLYYLSYALNTRVFNDEDALKLWIVCSIVILASIFVHGLSAPWLLKMTPNKPH